tara:strand:+ start:47 stop:160 length:114 start_codon:yes stop_codon:yes gene_type:complete
MTPEPSKGLIVILIIIGLGALYFVLFGQKRHNELMKK